MSVSQASMEMSDVRTQPGNDAKVDYVENSGLEREISPPREGITFEEGKMHRGLQSRHIQLIALGGTIV